MNGPLARRPGRLDRSRETVASPPRRCDRGDTVERAGADPRPRAGAAARPRPARGRVGSRRSRLEAPPRRRLAAARRGAPGSAARGGHREHVDVGGAVGRPPVAVASVGGGERRGARSTRCSGRAARCALRWPDRVRRALCTGAPVAPVAVAGRRSSPAARATTTAPPTGALCASRARRARAGSLEHPFHGSGPGVPTGDDRNHARAPCALPRDRVDRDRRHGRRLRVDRRHARSPGRDQDAERAIRRRPGDPDAVHPRGADRSAAVDRAERDHDLRCRRRGRSARHRDGVPPGRNAGRPDACGTHSAGARPCVARAGRSRARRRTRRRRHPSRRQAREPHARSRRRAARDRLRDRPDRGRRLADERGHDSRHLRLHVARAGRRGHRHRGKRPLRPRRRRVRAALRPQAVPGRDLRRRGSGARDGADPGRDGLRPFAASVDRCRARPRAREGPGGALSIVRRAGRELSGRRLPTAPRRPCGWPRPQAPTAATAVARRPSRTGRDDPHAWSRSLLPSVRWRFSASSSPRSSAEVATSPAAHHRRQDGDRGRRAGGAHRDRRGAARDASGLERPPPCRSQRRPRREGSALNDQGFRLLKAGDASAALPILERAVCRAAGLRLADGGIRAVQPRPGPVLDGRLQRRQGAARRLRGGSRATDTRSRISSTRSTRAASV